MTITNLDTYPHQFVSAKCFAEYLIVNERTVYHWISKGALRAIRLEGTVRIPIAEARRFVKASDTTGHQ